MNSMFRIWDKLLATLLVFSSLGCGDSGDIQVLTNQTNSTTLTSPVVLNSLEIGPAEALSSPGTTRAFTATAIFSDGSQQDVSGQVTWSSDHPNVTLTNTGQATVAETAPLGSSATITAQIDGISQSASLRLDSLLFAANATQDVITSYRRASDGTLTALGTEPLPGNNRPEDVIASPDGLQVYALDRDDSRVVVLAVEPDGTLSVGESAGSGGIANTIDIDPSGQFLYTLNAFDFGLTAFSIGASGSISPLSAVDVNTSNGIILHPSGGFLYTSDSDTDEIVVFDISNGGIPVRSSSVAFDSDPLDLAITPSGQYLYTANENDNNAVSSFLINADGSLTANGGIALSSTLTGVAVSPNGQFLIVTDSTQARVYSFQIATDGSLTAVNDLATSNFAGEPAVDPTNRFVYVADQSGGTQNGIDVFSLAADGSLAFVASADTGAVEGLDVSP